MEELSKTQKSIKKLSSDKKFEKIKAESKQWCFTCECGKESSIWDTGGIRYKASGQPKKRLICPHCQEIKWMKLYKKDS